jgi:hypothetical protein
VGGKPRLSSADELSLPYSITQRHNDAADSRRNQRSVVKSLPFSGFFDPVSHGLIAPSIQIKTC